MKTGKVPVNILKRSIINEIKQKNKEVFKGAGVGADYALLRLKALEDIVVTTNIYEASNSLSAALAVYKAGNNMACSGAVLIAVTVSMTLPVEFQESELKAYMKAMDDAAEKLQVEIAGGDTRISENVQVPILTVTGIGRVSAENSMEERKVCAGQELVVSKWIGMEGALLIVNAKEEELQNRYPYAMLDRVMAMEHEMTVLLEAATAVKSEVSAMHDLSEGGILGGLWEFAGKHGVGLEIDIKKIPVKQEVIEICEYFELNPYALRSGGSLLMAVNNGSNLVWELNKLGIEASVIGRITDGNDRIIRNQEETRYLDLPQADEIYKMKI
ncbi:MAG: hydrogenase maturation factor [Lachnospiraceae bacterium]|nr:hydrogenase maturation factor [Lachnospiraceae bacterium]